MTRKGYDSTSPKDCPDDGTVYAGYVDGLYETNHAAQKVLHPKALTPSVTLEGGTTAADFVDCEPGAVWPISAAVNWCLARHKAGAWFGIYCSESDWAAVKTAVHAAGLTAALGDHYWIAAYPGIGAKLYAGTVGHQYEGSPGNSPGHYDVSVWADHIPGLDPKPALKPTALSPTARRRAKNLTSELSRRTHPVKAGHGDRKILVDTRREINRALKLK